MFLIFKERFLILFYKDTKNFLHFKAFCKIFFNFFLLIPIPSIFHHLWVRNQLYKYTKLFSYIQIFCELFFNFFKSVSCVSRITILKKSDQLREEDSNLRGWAYETQLGPTPVYPAISFILFYKNTKLFSYFQVIFNFFLTIGVPGFIGWFHSFSNLMFKESHSRFYYYWLQHRLFYKDM